MSIERFLYPRLKGPRFEDRAIPLEFLRDLAVLEEMVVELAKLEFLRDNPNRKRSPKGFTEGIELKLTAIEDGSARPIISLVVASTALFPLNHQTFFERARDNIVKAIAAAENSLPVTGYLPEKTLTYFDRIGRSLRDGEAIEFTTPTSQEAAKLTKETRRRLVLASSRAQGMTEDTTIRGCVPEADQENMSFEVRLLDGTKVKGDIAPQHLDTIRDAWNGYSTGTRVLIQGIGRFNRNERLQALESIEHICLLDPLDVPARLEELRSLRDGWLEGQGLAPPSEGLDWLSHAFDRNYPEDLPLPFLYPTEEGGIQAEWSLGPNEVSLEIDLKSHTSDWHKLNVETDTDESRSLHLDNQSEWKDMVGWIRDMNGGEE